MDGKALIGIRTASHAFTLRDEDKEELAKHPERSEWVEFDREVLGGNYQGHHGTGPHTTIAPLPGVADNPIIKGMGIWFSRASLYKTSPVAADAEVLLLGGISGHLLTEPLAWTRIYGPGRARVFYTSLGSESDFAESQFRRMLVNAVQWALEDTESPKSFRLDDAKDSD
jgi:type 1 glutamine amidotransferase